MIPAGNFTLSIMYVEPGQGNAAHTHEVEECFFVLQGFLDVFVEDDSGSGSPRGSARWSASCPAGVIDGVIKNDLPRAGLLSGHARPRGKRRRWATPTMSCLSAAMRT